jgi:hypothetical protein
MKAAGKQQFEGQVLARTQLKRRMQQQREDFKKPNRAMRLT